MYFDDIRKYNSFSKFLNLYQKMSLIKIVVSPFLQHVISKITEIFIQALQNSLTLLAER